MTNIKGRVLGYSPSEGVGRVLVELGGDRWVIGFNTDSLKEVPEQFIQDKIKEHRALNLPEWNDVILEGVEVVVDYEVRRGYATRITLQQTN
jgi:hypothetical protein